MTSALEESAASFLEKQQIHSKLFSERVAIWIVASADKRQKFAQWLSLS